MTHAEAVLLADLVRSATGAAVDVAAEARFFVVTAVTDTGTYTLRDEAGWTWLARQLRGGD